MKKDTKPAMKRNPKKTLQRLLSLVLIATLVSQNSLQTLAAQAGAQTAAQSVAPAAVGNTPATENPEKLPTDVLTDTAPETDAEPIVLSEIEANRSPFSKEYLLSDNSREILVYPQQIHYQTQDGCLAEIDNSLIKTQDGYQNADNSYRLVITDNADSQGEVIYSENGYEIAWQMIELTEDTQDAENEAEQTARETGDETGDETAGTGEESSATTQKTVLQQTETITKKNDGNTRNNDSNKGQEAEKTGKKADKKANPTTEQTEQKEKNPQKTIHKPQLNAVVTDLEHDTDVITDDGALYRPKQSKITLDGYTDGVTVEYEPAGDGVKENIILPDKEAGSEYLFSIRLTGLKARLTAGSEIEFYDPDTEEVKYYFPAPFLIDSKGEISYEARYEIVDLEAEPAPGETEPEPETEPATETESGAEPETAPEPETESETETVPEPETESETETASESETETALEPETESETETVLEPAPESKTETALEPAPESETETMPESEGQPATETDNTTKPGTESNTAPGSHTAPNFAPVTEEENTIEIDVETSSPTETEAASESETASEEELTAETASQPATLYLKITLDEHWLAQASYPVTVDPVLKQYRAKNLMDSGCVVSDGTTRNDLYMGTNNTGTFRSYVRFALPQIPAQSIISEAVLDLGGEGTEGDTHYLTARTTTQPWYNTAPDQPGRKLTWDTQPATGDLLDYTVNAGSFNITKAVRKWYSGEQENYGIAFTAYDETVKKTQKIALKNTKTAPYLKITYRTATGLETYWGTHSASAGTAGAGSINDYTGALTVMNTDVATAGQRFPMSIAHVYNSNASDSEGKWHLNYQETIKIPLDTVNTGTYPYLYTDADGTQHYFKKTDVSYRENGVGTEALAAAAIPSARDEDGLNLYIVPVTDAALKTQYPLKLIDKSASVVKYFDPFGRLALITDSNQYENTKNKSTKEKNALTITYDPCGEELPLTAFEEALTTAQEFRTVCYTTGITAASIEYSQAEAAMAAALEKLKKDPYAKADYKTAKQIQAAMTALANLTDTDTVPAKTTIKTNADTILTALQQAQTRAQTLTGESNKRITAITDAVDNTAAVTYDADGRIVSITDPTYENGEANHYTYDADGNLTGITFANGKTATYTYDAQGLLTSQRDTDGYTITYTYSHPDCRITKVAESHLDTPGQTYTITYNPDNTTTYRYSGVDDVYGNDDDIQNIHVFDEQGRTTCIYSKAVNEDKILGATVATYQTESDNATARNKIKDTAVVGMHTDNLLTNHSFEYNDDKWTLYKNDTDTPESGALSAYSTAKKYTGTHAATVNMAKRTGGTAGFRQQTRLTPGTYTLSAYCTAASIANTAAYLKVRTADGTTYLSDKITRDTAAEFDNGWQRLETTFTITTTQTVTLCLETDCTATGTTAKAAGTVAFDCAQLETGAVANDYNILEDGSFELTGETLPYQWKNVDNSTIQVQDERIQGGVDGGYCYHITGQPGKDKYLRFKTNLGSTKNAYVLSGWVKTDTTPVRGSRAFKAMAYHEEEDDDGDKITYQATAKLNTYSEGWQYFCLLLPAHSWKDTSFTICFYDNIGDLYIDGLQLTKNDVQTRTYDSEGRLTTRYTAQKTTAYTYDDHDRPKKQTTPAGASYTYTYAANNEVKQVTASTGPENYYTYDAYGNCISTQTYDDTLWAGTQTQLYAQNTYTDDGNFPATTMDNAGNVTAYDYNTHTGQLEKTTLPQRGDGQTVTVNYTYDEEDRLEQVTQADRTVTYTYGEFDDLTAITHNGFTYGFTYDAFGNVLTTTIAGETISTNEYAPGNGNLVKTTLADGTVLQNTYDKYGHVTQNTVAGQVTNEYLYDNDGNLSRQTDNTAGLTTRYHYNDADMVVRSDVYEGDKTDAAHLESRMQYTYTKSGKVGTLSYQEKDSDIKTYTYTYAADELPVKNTYPDKSTTDWTYDTLRRTTKTVYTPKTGAAASKKLYTTYTYQSATHTIGGKTRTTTTGLVNQYTNKFGSTGTAVSQFTYTYDAWGNITAITDLSGKKRTYTYNDYGEITQASETYADGTTVLYEYEYDDGNLLTETVNGTVHTYTYDTGWKDRLMSYDGRPITYDTMGRPTNYMGQSMTWDANGSLTSVTKTGENEAGITYTYLSNGQRRTKTVNGVTTTYRYNNGLLLSETTGDETLCYTYDSTGKVTGITYQKGSNAEVGYFFTRNAQGDIIGVYRNSDSKLIGTYEYDLWGRPVSVKEASAGVDTDGILTKNPLRYRGYYYDEETGFYYLNARYYDPEVRRFISADNVITRPGTSVQGHNLFAYCWNNPVSMTDETGRWPTWGQVFSAVVTVAVAAVFVAAVVASAGAVGVAAGVAAASIGATGTMVSTAITVGTVGTYVVAGGIGACALSNAGEILTGTNVIRDGLMGGNQEAYNIAQTALNVAGGVAVMVGQTNPGVTGKAARPKQDAQTIHKVPKTGPANTSFDKIYSGNSSDFQRTYYDYKGDISLQIDFTHHSNPLIHSNPHLHIWGPSGRSGQINLWYLE